MGRKRYVHTNISRDKEVNRLAMTLGGDAALLFTWGMLHAEDDCSIDRDPEEMLMEVFPGRRDLTAADVHHFVEGMLERGLLQETVDPKLLRYKPESFYRIQSYIPEHKRRPVPPLHPEDRCKYDLERGPEDPNEPQRRLSLGTEDQQETPQISAEERTPAEKAVSPSPTQRTVEVEFTVYRAV